MLDERACDGGWMMVGGGVNESSVTRRKQKDLSSRNFVEWLEMGAMISFISPK
jgi:hypothetical protein